MNTKQLRRSILQLAIRGRLVPQDPTDEPAIELLKRINPKAAPIAPDNAPFDVPDSWCWCKVEDLSNVCSARRVHKRDWRSTGVPFYRAREIGKLADCGHVDNELFIDKELYDAFSQSGVPQAGDLMITAVGTLGKVYIVKDDDTFYYKDASVICLQNIYSLSPQFLKLVIESPSFIAQYAQESQGTTVATLTMERFNKYTIPLPPLAEQERIVKEVERWFACIEQLERSREALGKAARQTKRTLLSLAIAGRLVPQCPADEPAIELLKRINPKFTPQPTDQPLPPGWTACRLEDIVDYEQPQAYIVESTDYNDNYETPVLTAGKSFIKGYTKETSGIYNNLPCIIFDDFTTDSRYIDFPFKVKSSAMKILRVHAFSTKYVALFMSITRLIGDTHKRYWISEYSKLSFPLPPLAEQERIVGKVEELFAVLDALQ